MNEGFIEPCDQEVVYTEGVTQFGARYLQQTCTCGADLGSHSLVNESALRYWCDRVITREDAIEGLGEILFCHRKGVTYSAYMGIRENGDDMTDEEYAPVRERLSA